MVLGIGSVICSRALAMLQSFPHVRISLQYAVLRKKTHKVRTRYLASDVLVDVLVWLVWLPLSST